MINSLEFSNFLHGNSSFNLSKWRAYNIICLSHNLFSYRLFRQQNHVYARFRFYFCHPTKSTYVTYLYIVLLFLLIRLFIFCHCQVLFLAYKYVSLAINFFRCSYLFMFFIFHAFLHLFLVWLLREVQKKIIRRPTYVVFVAVFRIIWCLL